MHYTYTPAMLPLLIAGLASVAVAFYISSRREKGRQARYFTALAVSIGIWALGYSLEIAGTTVATKLFWGQIQYLGIASLPIFWTLFAFSYAHKPLRWRTIFLLSVIPTLTILFVFWPVTRPLVWTSIDVAEFPNFTLLALGHGPWFWVNNLYAQALLLYSTYLLLKALWNRESIYRRQLVIMMAGLLAPWAGNILYIIGASPIPHLDLTPFGFAITVLALAWGIFGYQLLNLAPVAREMVVDALQEGILVIDNSLLVVDINRIAGRIIGVKPEQALGSKVQDLLQPWPELTARVTRQEPWRGLLTIGQGESQRNYDVSISAIKDRDGSQLGLVISLHSLTANVPLPDFAPDLAEDSGPAPVAQPAESPSLPARQRGNWLLDFFTVPDHIQQEIPKDYLLANERALTIILRVTASVGLIALLAAPNLSSWTDRLPLLAILLGLWIVGVARRLPYTLRLHTLLLLLFGLSTVEVWRFGYSLESMLFFTAFTTANALLNKPSRNWIGLPISAITLGALGWMILNGHLKPTPSYYLLPDTPSRAVTVILAFLAVNIGLVLIATLLTNNMRLTALREEQARHLLQQERDLLEQRVRERTLSIENARQALELAYNQAVEANKAKSQLLASVSHELRTPLGAIIGYAELLSMDNATFPPEEQQDMLQQIVESAKYLNTIVDDLLQEAQLARGTLTVTPGNFLIKELFATIEKQMRPLAIKKGLVFNVSFADDLPESVFGDPHRIQQIAINLIGNAIKFTEQGQVSVNVGRSSATEWQFSVTDTGPGISAEHLGTIFEPFRQVENALTRQHRGTGLGLSISRQLVRLMGGEIYVTSQPGQGSTFTVILPIQKPATQQMGEQQP